MEMNKTLFSIPTSLLLLIFISIPTFSKLTNSATDQDQDSLLAIKSKITSDPSQILSKSWNTNTSICNWIGVHCSSTIHPHRVTSLNFSNFGFEGTVAPNLGNLTLLTSLDLSSNNFTGTMPYEISHLRRLRVINVGYNSFTGDMPSWLGALPHLEHLHLNNNIFSAGTIPEGTGNLSSLKTLDLSHNQITGSLPHWIFNMSSIEVLNLTSNRLSGSLPMGMCHYSRKLNKIYLSENQLDGSIPSNIYNCSELQELSLSDNHFGGRIPSEIGRLTKLRFLYLAGNDFQGEFPSQLQNLSRLEALNIASASLSGQIPSFLFNMSSLEYINLSNNTLSGNLPPGVYNNLPNLQFLSLASNNLTGQVLEKLLECKRLQMIYLSKNNFTGTIPKNIGNMTSLTHLSFSFNNFTGELPSELGNLNVVQISGHDNGLSGPIPSSMFNISTLMTMELSDNHLTGELPSTMGHSLPSLTGLSLGSNELHGVIPSFTNNASQLTIINLAYNSFTGSIPNLGNLRFLQRLYIGANNLTGESSNQELSFLSSLTYCHNLEDFEVSQNQLDGVLPASIGNFSTSLQRFKAFDCGIRGSIPDEIGNLTNLQGLYLDNNLLTGIIPRTIGKSKELTRVYLEHNKLEGYIPNDLCQLVNLGDLYLSNNLLHGSIPACFGELKSLRGLYLDSNSLESYVPLGFWNLSGLLRLNLSSNMLNGSVELRNLNHITELDLSWNQFTGAVLNSIDHAELLIYLSVEHNKFQGSIPQSLGNLKGLEKLDLSYNNFSGFIPRSLEGLTFLQDFDVSNNRLEGQIPTGGILANFTAQSFLNNSGLCGAPNLQVAPCEETRPKHVSSPLRYILPSCVAAVIVVTVILMKVRKPKSSPPPIDIEASLLPSWTGSSYFELLRATENFSESNILGKGSFGSVFKGTLSDGLIVAVKVFNTQSERVKKSFNIEVEVVRNIRHRNLVKIIGCCTNEDFKALVLEYMPNGSLEKWLHSDEHCLDMLQRLGIAIDVALALEYMHIGHTFPIVHCDLKPSNVLLNEDMTAFVSDFGVAKLFGEGELMVQTRTLATIGYMAPEYGTEGIVSTSGDVFSFGIMLLEMFTKKRPTDEMFNEEMSLKSWVSQSLHEDVIDEVVDSNLFDRQDEHLAAKVQCVSSVLPLAMECLAISPSDRISMKEIVSNLGKIRTKFLQP